MSDKIKPALYFPLTLVSLILLFVSFARFQPDSLGFGFHSFFGLYDVLVEQYLFNHHLYSDFHGKTFGGQ